jgi:hypothetical protein
MVVVALGKPSVPVICWALTGTVARRTRRQAKAIPSGSEFPLKLPTEQ